MSHRTSVAGARRAWMRPRNRVEAQLAAIWEEMLETSPVSIEDDFFELGGDSITASRLMWRIEETLGARLPPGALFEAPTVAGLAAMTSRRSPVAEWTHLVPMQPRGDATPLFCIHNYNGEVWLYAELARSLGPDQPLYGLQAAGVNRPGRPLLRVEQMAARYIEEMQSVQPHGPYHLGGICFGAYVALEVACQLAERGETVGLLASFDTFAYAGAPAPAPSPVTARLRRVWPFRGARRILRDRLAWLGQEAELLGFQLGLKTRTPADDEARRELLSKLNARARVRYRPRRYPGKVTIICCSGSQKKDPDQFWGGVAGQGVACVEIPGEHITMLDRGQVDALAVALRGCLRGFDQA